jgi:O-antigen/teichoic acid export membrane protein
VSQIYVALVGIGMVPLYLRYMGIEAYGLVGLFVMLQAWFQLLDLGLTPTISRETARYAGGAGDGNRLRRLMRVLEALFVTIAIVGAGALAAAAAPIARQWLNVRQLPLAEVEQAVQLMAVLVALRWVCGLYRGAISGFERLVWLAGFNALAATARFVLVLPYFWIVGASATDFFRYQLAVAALEFTVLVIYTYRLLPKATGPSTVSWSSLHSTLKFSLGIAFTSSIWVFVTQTDKLILSKLLPLGDYAHFTLAVLMASGVQLLGAPIGAAVLPRLTRLCAEADEVGLLRLYRSATQLVGVLTIPASLVLACFARQVVWAWTGDPHIAEQAAPVLTLYALGNGILALATLPYQLQFAKGDLKLHIIGHILFVVLLIPALIVATLRWGMVGAGYAWLAANVAYFVGWVPRIHRRFFKGLHTQWLLRDLGPIIACAASGALLTYFALETSSGRLAALAHVGIASTVILTLAALGSSSVRATIQMKLHALRTTTA